MDTNGNSTKTKEFIKKQLKDSPKTQVYCSWKDASSLVTPNGKIGIVLPSGVFNNKTSEYVRQWIQQNINVKLIVSLPITTFKLSGANNFTSILFGKKKLAPNDDMSAYAVSIAKHIGFDEKGNTVDKNGDAIPTDLPKIKDLFFKKVGWGD